MSFICSACGGWKYGQTSTLGPPTTNDQFCSDCVANGALEVHYGEKVDSQLTKLGLHAVLVSAFGETVASRSFSFNDWINANGGEEETAAVLQTHCPVLWARHYHLITGEYWE
jgi:hypothetical protein